MLAVQTFLMRAGAGLDRLRLHLTNPLTLGCWFTATLVTTLMGPFGTYLTMETIPRLIYWASINIVSIVVAYAVRVVIADWLPPMSRNRQEVLMPILFSLVFTPILRFLNHDLLEWEANTHMSTFAIFVFNALVAAAILVVRRWLGFAFVTGVEPMPAFAQDGPGAQVPRRPRFYARLAEGAGRVMRLTVDDHYVIALCDDGSEHRLLMRFADAVAEMEGQDGFFTHRSHWVSAHAGRRGVRIDGRDMLELVDGSLVPVSRTYRPVLDARGFAGTSAPMAVPSE